MPYNKELTERVRTVLINYPGCVEKKMFGGVGFILNGNLACGIQGNDLIVRVGTESYQYSLSLPSVRPFMGVPGKIMVGWILVGPEGVSSPEDLQHWVE